MADVPAKDAEKWGAFYRAGAGLRYPDENLVRIVRGQRVAGVPKSGRALDLGFGTGPNLVMLAQTGFEAHGLEVDPACIEAAHRLAALENTTLHLGLLAGTALPYPDQHFDLVVSWNAIYYYGNRTLVRDALRDIHRVLRPGGVLLLSIIHPNNAIVQRLSPDLGDGAHRFERDGVVRDPRTGMTIFYEPQSAGWRTLLSPFERVEEGYVEVELFAPEHRNAWRLFVAQKAPVTQPGAPRAQP
jgi:SAM-dependent methyltransferase